jgi:AcrR family transcriptional regulator
MTQPSDKAPTKTRQSGQKPRLNAHERRQHILQKAAGLVSEKGPSQVTTRQIAEEASVSEALLYQHFPSKDEMFREVSDILQTRLPSLHDYFAETTPSSRVVVEYLYLTAYVTLHPTFQNKEQNLPRQLLESLLSDGTFLTTHINRRWRLIEQMLTQSVESARNAGHLTKSEIDRSQHADQLVIMFSHQLMIMLHCFQSLPDRPIFDTPPKPDDLIDQVVLFVLRGVGFKEAVINRLYQPAKIVTKFRSILMAKDGANL